MSEWVCERERQRERAREIERERASERAREREREREREKGGEAGGRPPSLLMLSPTLTLKVTHSRRRGNALRRRSEAFKKAWRRVQGGVMMC